MTKDLVMRIFYKYFFFKLLGVHDMRNSQIIHKKSTELAVETLLS